jgi:hypothetical protein
MPTVVATVARYGRTFSSIAAASVVGDVSGRTRRPAATLRLPRRNDRARVAVPVTVGPARQ